MKSVLITGASGGIGSAIARRFASEGYDCALQYRTAVDKINALSDELAALGRRSCALQSDLTDYSAAADMLEAARILVGSPEVIVCCAGICDIRLFTDITPDIWKNMLDSNLTSVYNCCHAAVKAVTAGGMDTLRSIVNVSSVWGIHGASCESHYSAAKAGIIGLTKALAKELGPSCIRVNCVAPGVIDTEMNRWLSEEELDDIIDRTPLCRIGTPDEAASAVYFLGSEQSSFVTGAVLEVTGGFY